jgi:hypothetical protein
MARLVAAVGLAAVALLPLMQRRLLLLLVLPPVVVLVHPQPL